MKINKFLFLGGFVMLASLMSSCEKIFDEAQGCGLYIDFKYDYNMLYTDAFHSQVKKVDVYVFDRDSNFLFQQTAEGAQLANNNYRMYLNVPSSEKNDFIAMAWAGSTEKYIIQPKERRINTIKDLRLQMQQQEDGINNMDLGDLWYGEIKHINYLAQGEQTDTINLIKNTNRFKIIIQQMGVAEPTSINDFSINLMTDNTYYNHKNEVISTHVVSYQPYAMRDVETVGAVAELNTMRLLVDNPLKLIIHNSKQKQELLNIDLMQYLLATKMEGHQMTAQEYLDRQSEFTIILFYNNEEHGSFMAAKIVINDWTLWMHEADL